MGGFSPELYAGEEIALSRQLKRWGRKRGLVFTILKGCRHSSSGRKFELYTGLEIAGHILRCFFLPHRTLRHRRHLDFYYDGRR